MVLKSEKGYMLGPAGLAYIGDNQLRIITMIVIQNSEGDILLQRRTKQPYINTWTLPYTKLHLEDESTIAATQRLAEQKLNLKNGAFEQAGDCYIRVYGEGELISTTLVHVFRAYHDDVTLTDNLQWARPHKLSDYALAPAVEEIMTRTFFKDPFYFEEFIIDWYS